MRQRTEYEWNLEQIDEHGDALEVHYADTLKELLVDRSYNGDMLTCVSRKHRRLEDTKVLTVALSRRVVAGEDHPSVCEGDDLDDPQYACFLSVDMQGTRTYTNSTNFSRASLDSGDGQSIPKKYLAEFKRWRNQ